MACGYKLFTCLGAADSPTYHVRRLCQSANPLALVLAYLTIKGIPKNSLNFPNVHESLFQI
jgi:hypothetical protein